MGQNFSLRSRVQKTGNEIPLVIVAQGAYADWLKTANKKTRDWAKAPGVGSGAGTVFPVYKKPGIIGSYVAIVSPEFSPAHFAMLPGKLPAAEYVIAQNVGNIPGEAIALGWAMGSYCFDQHKTQPKSPLKQPYLVMPDDADEAHVLRQAEAIYNVQNLTNQPANHVGPRELAQIAMSLASKFNAEAKSIKVDDDKQFPLIWAVGMAAEQTPRLIDMKWGNPDNPLITIIGKGVTYDTGGLALKTRDGMLTMRKDKGGAAHAFGLAAMIMDAKLPYSLRVVVPAVENAINERAYRNGDILKSRSGKTVEVINTDAEGRLVLADAITYAEETNLKPSVLLIDFATLTGAARTVGEPGTPVIMGSDKAILRQLEDISHEVDDRLQVINLDARNDKKVAGDNADLKNSGDELPPHIMAAHFLKSFVGASTPWIHVDQSAWEGKGAKAQAIRAVYEFIRRMPT